MNATLPVYPHLHPDAVARLRLSASERIEYIRKRDHFQQSPDLQGDMKVLDRIIAQGPGKRRRNVKVLGDPGLGKSTLLVELQKKYPPALIPGTTMMSKPVVIFSMTAIRTCEDFCKEVEKKLGLPAPLKKMRDRERIEKAIDYMNKTQCRLAAFDEFQDLKNITAKVRSEIVQLVKLFANEGLFPVCVAGSENSVAVLDDCPHMRSRFRTCVERRVWTKNKNFETWFFGLISRYPILKPSKIFDPNSLQQILARSGGNTEAIVYASSECAAEAIENGTETIDRTRLYELLLG